MPATPGIILTDYRTGGSFLSLCLDSHPLIFCQRGEPLARRSGLYRYFPDLAPEQVLQYIFRTEFCELAMCKVIYRQAGPKVWKYLAGQKGIKVIHLVRRNELRAACSFLFQKAVLQGKAEHPHPLHHFNRQPKQPKPIRLAPQAILDLCRERIKARKAAYGQIDKHKLSTKVVYYEHMTEGEEIEALPEALNDELCRFFDVPYYQMAAPFLHRVNAQYPLSELIANWRQVKALIQETEFGHYLEGE